MAYENPPTARTLGLTNKISTWVGPDTDPPTPDGIGDIWYVEHPTAPNLFLEIRRWNGTTWVPVNQSFLRTNELTKRRIELGENPADTASTSINEVRIYRAGETIDNPTGRIRSDSAQAGVHYDAEPINGYHYFHGGRLILEEGIAAGPATGGASVIKAWDMSDNATSFISGGNGRAQFSLAFDPLTVSLIGLAYNVRNNSTARMNQLHAATASSFTVSCRDGTGALLPDGTQINVSYIAFAG